MSKSKSASDILEAGLRSLGADGLCTEECGCALDGLAPCGEIKDDCAAARRVEYGSLDCMATDCEWHCLDSGNDPRYCYVPMTFEEEGEEC